MKTITTTVFADSDLSQGVDHEFGSTDLGPLIARLQELDGLLKDQTGKTPALALQNEVGDVLRMAEFSLTTVKDTLFARSMTELADSGRAKDALAHLRAVGAKNGIQRRALRALEKANAPRTLETLNQKTK